jgi:hypothetical protein
MLHESIAILLRNTPFFEVPVRYGRAPERAASLDPKAVGCAHFLGMVEKPESRTSEVTECLSSYY